VGPCSNLGSRPTPKLSFRIPKKSGTPNLSSSLSLRLAATRNLRLSPMDNETTNLGLPVKNYPKI
jgi:hypothetical protein